MLVFESRENRLQESGSLFGSRHLVRQAFRHRLQGHTTKVTTVQQDGLDLAEAYREWESGIPLDEALSKVVGQDAELLKV